MAQTTKKIQQYKIGRGHEAERAARRGPGPDLLGFPRAHLPPDDGSAGEAHGEAHRLPRGAQHLRADRHEGSGLSDASTLAGGAHGPRVPRQGPQPRGKGHGRLHEGRPAHDQGRRDRRKLFSSKDIEALSKLPGRSDLLAMLMGTMNAPLRNMMYAMNGVASKLVRTLAAVAEKKENWQVRRRKTRQVRGSEKEHSSDTSLHMHSQLVRSEKSTQGGR